MPTPNKWTGSRTALTIPPLPPAWRGVTACQFQEGIFDSKTGSEVYLLILDSPEYVRTYAAIRPFDLYCTAGLVRTSQGVVAYLIWTVAAGSNAEAQTEHFLNPSSTETIRLVSVLAEQSHMKALLVDSDSGDVCDWFEFENNFGFREFGELMVQSGAAEPIGDFQAATTEVMQQYTTADLLKAG